MTTIINWTEMKRWWIDSDNVIQIVSLKDKRTGNYINNAVGIGQLRDSEGTDVDDPISFAYVARSNGNYLGKLPYGASLTAGSFYTMTVTVSVAINDEQAVVKITRRAAYKGV